MLSNTISFKPNKWSKLYLIGQKDALIHSLSEVKMQEQYIRRDIELIDKEIKKMDAGKK